MKNNHKIVKVLIEKIFKSERIRIFVLAIAAWVIYLNSLHGSFHFDDTYNIVENPFVKSLKFFFQFFTDANTHSALPENSPYRPICTLTYAVLWALGGGSVVPFRLYKIFQHMFVGILIYWIAKKLLEKQEIKLSVGTANVAFFGALLFLVHPSQTETLNYISSLSSLQCTLFYLLAFYLFIEKRFILSGLAIALALFTKEEALSYPGVLGLYGLVFSEGLRPYWKEYKRGLIISLSIFFFYLLVRFIVIKTQVVFGIVSPYEYFLTSIRAWIYYLVTILRPWGYSVEHMGFGFSRSLFEPSVLICAVISLAIFYKIVRWRFPRINKQANLFLSFGFAWFFITIAPSSSFLALAEPINEHRYYLPYTLLFPALVFGVFQLVDRKSQLKKLVEYSLPILVVGLGILTVLQNRIWRTQFSLWEDVVKKDPTNGRAHNNFGVRLLERGKLLEAHEQFKLCEKYMPYYEYCLINQLVTLRTLGKIEEARDVASRMIRLKPNAIMVQQAYGAFLDETEGKYEQALSSMQFCDAISGGKSLPCLYRMARLQRKLKRPKDALQTLSKIESLQGTTWESQFERGLLLIDLKKFDEAYAIYDSLYQSNPSDIQSLHNLAWIEMEMGRYESSKEKWFRKLKIMPADQSAWLHLKIIAEKTKDKALSKMVMDRKIAETK
ncbi:MAG: hypothetical protein AB7F43_00710 [Bacteriovoracia bacterium]